MSTGKLTLVDKDLSVDIQTMSVISHGEIFELIYLWLSTKETKETVFVCFQSWEDIEYKNQIQNITITHYHDVIEETEMDYITPIPIEEVNYNVFEFESYEEAFKYCQDLKDGL